MRFRTLGLCRTEIVSDHRSLWKLGFPRLTLLVVLSLTGCWTVNLKMPPVESVSSPAGPTVEVAPMVDERASVVLGKVDTLTVASGPDLVRYVEAEMVNALSRMGFAVRQVDPSTPIGTYRRVLAALTGTELSSESTLLHPVVAAVRVRIEIIDESQQSTFRKEIRGSISRDLGRHKQGGPEDAQLLAEAVQQALARLAADESFAFALSSSPEEMADQQASEERARKAAAEALQRRRVLPEGQPEGSAADRLSTLDHLLKEGLINQDDYNRKRQEILDDL